MVHMVRNSLRYVSWKDGKAIIEDLRAICAAPTLKSAEEATEEALEACASKWDDRLPFISASRRANWQRVIPFFGYPPAIRKVVYTTNATLCKVTRKLGAFPNPESVRKVLDLTIRKATEPWSRPIRDWAAAINHFTILF